MENLVEVVEISDHPWFVGCQFHPEFTSTPRDGHSLFQGFVKARQCLPRQSDQARGRLSQPNEPVWL